MAGLDIYSVEAHLEGQPRGPDVLLHEPVQVLVGQHWMVRVQIHPSVPMRVMLRNQWGRFSLWLGIPAGVRKLSDHHRTMILAHLLSRRLPDGVHQASELVSVLLCQPQLPGIGPRLRRHGYGFGPQ